MASPRHGSPADLEVLSKSCEIPLLVFGTWALSPGTSDWRVPRCLLPAALLETQQATGLSRGITQSRGPAVVHDSHSSAPLHGRISLTSSRAGRPLSLQTSLRSRLLGWHAAEAQISLP